MTDLNKQELRRLAEAVPHKDWYAGNAYGKKFIADYQIIAPTPEGNYVLLEGNQNFLDHAVANIAFVGACSPSAVLALLDELAQAKCEAGHAIQQKDAAYSECKALRQDAERYRALREMNWCDGPLAVVVDPYSRIKLGSDCPSHERLDEAVDIIIAKAAAPQNQNTGHGHVFPRPDGNRARCGGPGLCRECAADAARKEAARHD